MGIKENLIKQVDKIFKEELVKENIEYTVANARIYNKKSVGVQGDERTYAHPAEIELRKGGKIVWDIGLLEKLSSRIIGEVKGINRVVYVISNKNL